jgi:hypothetical protein
MTVVQADKWQQDGIAARRRSNRALIAATVVALALAGCRPSGGSASSGTPSPPSGTSTSTGSGSPTAAGACAGRGTDVAPTIAKGPGTKWPERRAVSPGRTPAYSGMAVDPATDTAYALVPLAGSQSGARYQLTCATEPGGPVTKGLVPEIPICSGVRLPVGVRQARRKAVVSQINPRTLRVIRSITLPGEALPATRHCT